MIEIKITYREFDESGKIPKTKEGIVLIRLDNEEKGLVLDRQAFGGMLLRAVETAISEAEGE